MASTRTARVLAAVAALPMAALLFSGVASADDGNGNQVANRGSNAAAAGIIGSGVAGPNEGASTTGQQQAVGTGASNQNNTASVVGSEDTEIQQENVAVSFTELW
ncbi:hypothetical protein [Streptomyces sp. ISL-11]|uniref:hypothetical protein n=1 Tax=Streptomyces sp. ISL-11 TaxID=2819174 RepID=UPI001BE780ED|nr:hypothetical protein [Streptomyces sp. ISL-11]MBT2384443.1 hypothetical protein [Streptomyces sp. ISL-11]